MPAAPTVHGVVPAGRIDTYRVESDPTGTGEWHILTVENGVEVQIYTTTPLLFVAPETM